MGVITLLTDFGKKDYYLAALKAKLYSIAPNIPVFDISHQISKYNIPHAAYTLGQVFQDFPTGSVHIIDVDAVSENKQRFILAKIDEHYFITPDNGIISILTKSKITSALELEGSPTAFPSKDIMANIAAKIIEGADISSLGIATEEIFTLKKREVKITDNSLHGNVIHIDDYGNLVTNIERDHFEAVSNDRSVTIKFRFEAITKMANYYGDVEGGETAIFFNDKNHLEIAINRGNASQLLGLKYDTPINIEFGETDLFQ